MKGGLASLIFVAGLLQEFAPSLNLKGSLGVIASPDEENGGIEVASLLAQGLIKGDACLIGTNAPRHPNAGEKTMAFMRVTIPGRPDMAAYNHFLGSPLYEEGAHSRSTSPANGVQGNAPRRAWSTFVQYRVVPISSARKSLTVTVTLSTVLQSRDNSGRNKGERRRRRVHN